jgi:ferredoxin
MKLQLDSTKCQGYGLCQEEAADMLEIDEWGYAAVIGDVTDEAAARAAADACPVQALRLLP